MPVGFIATRLSISEEHGVLAIMLSAESSAEDDFYLMLQRRNRSSALDARSGMDQPYIEYCGQGWSWYGHIECFELHRDRVRVELDREAATHMRNDGRIAVGFALEDGDFSRLRQALARIFRDCCCFTTAFTV